MECRRDFTAGGALMNCDPVLRRRRCVTGFVLFLIVLPVATHSMPAQDTSSIDPGADRWSVLSLLRYQAGMRTSILARDVYKLLYQASMGAEHLLTDTAGVRAYLAEELSGIDSGFATEPLLERISPDGEMVRVNLRPFRALNLPAESLVQAMFTSAAETVADTALLYRWWDDYSSLVGHGVISPAPEDMVEWDGRVRRGQIGPFHHSEAYEMANRPAYRVVRRDVILILLNNLGIR
jgi:hypothetical protein